MNILEPEYWNKQAKDHIIKTVKLDSKNFNVAKNVIVFLGDGMGISTLTAARIFKGQLKLGNKHAEGERLSFETFPHVGLLSVSIEFPNFLKKISR